MRNKIALRLDLTYIFLFWVAIGQFVAYLISNGLLVEFGECLYQNFGVFIPSVHRMDKVVFFDNLVAKQYASIFFFLIPFLFVTLLFSNVEASVSEVRKNKKETYVAWVFFAVGSLAFIGGLNISGPKGIFHNSIYGFGLLAATMTFLSAYCFRIVLCIAFNK
ncbi:MAG: hypothetical protein Q8N89_02505 [Azonexus sp.]|nr:hypothetical protein [Azonexus sp.]